jgi:hypothetical protein
MSTERPPPVCEVGTGKGSDIVPDWSCIDLPGEHSGEEDAAAVAIDLAIRNG